MDDMDPDGSGEVDFAEFAQWCNRELPKDRLDDMYSWKLVQSQMLHNSAGKLNFAMSRLLRMWFNEADTDGGGSLEGKEIAKLASMLLGRQLNENDTRVLMEQMDPVLPCDACDGGRRSDQFCTACNGRGTTGGDGEVDFFEFEVRTANRPTCRLFTNLLGSPVSAVAIHSTHMFLRYTA